MIQRIQTVYMALAVVLTVACLCLPVGVFTYDELAHAGIITINEYNLCLVVDDIVEYTTWPMFAVLVPSAALGVYSIFAYGNRRAQARFCVFNALLLVGWYVLYAVCSRVCSTGNGIFDFRPTVFAAFPCVALILYMMARRAILADEALVRAADRIR